MHERPRQPTRQAPGPTHLPGQMRASGHPRDRQAQDWSHHNERPFHKARRPARPQRRSRCHRREPARARPAPRQTRGRSCPSSLGSCTCTFKSYTSVGWQPPTDRIDHVMVLSLAHKHMSVSAPGHRGFLWHTIGGSDTNMGHMAHLSRLPGSTSWGIHIGKEPYVGASSSRHRTTNGRITAQ